MRMKNFTHNHLLECHSHFFVLPIFFLLNNWCCTYKYISSNVMDDIISWQFGFQHSSKCYFSFPKQHIKNYCFILVHSFERIVSKVVSLRVDIVEFLLFVYILMLFASKLKTEQKSESFPGQMKIKTCVLSGQIFVHPTLAIYPGTLETELCPITFCLILFKKKS